MKLVLFLALLVYGSCQGFASSQTSSTSLSQELTDNSSDNRADTEAAIAMNAGATAAIATGVSFHEAFTIAEDIATATLLNETTDSIAGDIEAIALAERAIAGARLFIEMADYASTNSTDMEEAIIMNAGIAAAVATGAPLNSTDAIAEAIAAANATNNATESGIAAAIFSGVPIDETAAIAEAIATAAFVNTPRNSIAIDVEVQLAPIAATKQIGLNPNPVFPGEFCPNKPYILCPWQDRKNRWFKSHEGKCEQVFTCPEYGFKRKDECRISCN